MEEDGEPIQVVREPGMSAAAGARNAMVGTRPNPSGEQESAVMKASRKCFLLAKRVRDLGPRVCERVFCLNSQLREIETHSVDVLQVHGKCLNAPPGCHVLC